MLTRNVEFKYSCKFGSDKHAKNYAENPGPTFVRIFFYDKGA